MEIAVFPYTAMLQSPCVYEEPLVGSITNAWAYCSFCFSPQKLKLLLPITSLKNG